MSRSIRKTHKIKTCGNCSNKKDKIYSNRQFRRVNKILLKQGKQLKLIREISDVWDFKSDGLAVYRNDLTPKELRK